MSAISSPKTSKSFRGNSARRWVSLLVAALLAVVAAVVVTSPAHAATLPFYGTVKDSNGNGIAGVSVYIHDQADNVSATATTVSNGFFSFSTVPTDGNYTIEYIPSNVPNSNYATMYYPSTPFPAEAQTLALSNTSSIGSIGVTLTAGIILSGHVTQPGPTHSIWIAWFAYDSVANTWPNLGGLHANGSGDWQGTNLPAGDYRVEYLDESAAPKYIAQYYPSVTHLSDAQIIYAAQGSTTTHIDDTLSLTPYKTVRLAGSDRFATSARVAQEYNHADVIFLANGINYADALSAAPAAAIFPNSPLLLTLATSIPAVIAQEITRLKPTTVFVIGGPGVVSDAVLQQVETLTGGAIIQRVWGTDRYATSKAVFDTFWGVNDSSPVFLADGRNFPDALSSAPAAQAATHGPVILVNGGSTTLPDALMTDLNHHASSHIFVAGGYSVVSQGIEGEASAVNTYTVVTRLSGIDRYATSQAVNEHFFHPTTATVFLAVGTGFADALAGAARAGVEDAPLYLVPGNCIPQTVLNDISTLHAARIVILGGTGVLSSAVANLTSCNSVP